MDKGGVRMKKLSVIALLLILLLTGCHEPAPAAESNPPEISTTPLRIEKGTYPSDPLQYIGGAPGPGRLCFGKSGHRPYLPGGGDVYCVQQGESAADADDFPLYRWQPGSEVSGAFSGAILGKRPGLEREDIPKG